MKIDDFSQNNLIAVITIDNNKNSKNERSQKPSDISLFGLVEFDKKDKI